MYGYELYEDLGVNDEWPNTEERYLFDPENIDPYKLFPILEGKKAIEVPKLQNFETYIQLHFRDQLVDEFCRYIATGAADIYSDTAVRPDIKSARFLEMHFYAESRTEVCADIKMQILVSATDDGETYLDDITRTFRVLFIMEPRKRTRGKVLEIFQNWPKQKRKKLWNLSSYLIPRLTKDDLENYTRDILKKYLPEGLEDQHKNDAYKLAENMGLTVVPLPLHGYTKTRTILFFRKGTISIDIEDPVTEKTTTKVVTVERNTIVVNTNVVHSFCDRYCIDVYHECIHFEWHYLFYRLQDMHNNDLKKIRKEYKIRYNRENVQDSLSWLEWQAKRGSMCIWMPKPFMDSEMLTLSKNSRWDLRSEKYEYIGTEISEEYKIPKYRIRARMINLGMIEAKGAFNYYVDHYVRPFAFSTQQYLGNHTFFIEPKEFARLFREDLRFRELMTTCNLVYVDGFVCLNDPSYIRMGYDGTPHLTDEARFAVDKCCLRFEEIYELDSEIGYCFGRLNSDLPFNEHYFQYPGCGVIAHLTYCDKMKNLKEYVESLPRTFSAMLTKFMGDMGMTSDQLMRATGFSESTVQRLRNKGSINYKVDKVVALICLFHLPPPVSLVFLQSAGISIFDNTEDCVYQMIVSNMYYYSIEALQKTLKSMGYKELCLTEAADDTLKHCS